MIDPLCTALLELVHVEPARRPQAAFVCHVVAFVARAHDVDPALAVSLAWAESKLHGRTRRGQVGPLQVTRKNLRRFGPDPIGAGITVLRRWLDRSRTAAQAVCRYRKGWRCPPRGDPWATTIVDRAASLYTAHGAEP